MRARGRKLLQQASSRHGRGKTGLFLAEGLRCCHEGLINRPQWLELVVFSEVFAHSTHGRELAALVAGAGQTPEVVRQHEFNDLALTEHPQGVLCVFQRQTPAALGKTVNDPFILILDRVGEPGNLGTILRTAWAIGLDEVWCTIGTADPYGPKAIRAGMGAQFSLKLRDCADLNEGQEKLKQVGFNRLWLSGPGTGTSCYAPEFDLHHSGLVIGNEASGVSEISNADRVTIPMPGRAESLNAAQAATILMFEAVRRRLLE